MNYITLDRVTHIEFPNNPEISTFDIHIESGSLFLEEILCQGNIVFGETNATRFEATVYNLQDVSGLKIKVYQTDSNGNNYADIFTGYVDSCKQDKDGYYRKIVAYDALYSIGNVNIAGIWFSLWESVEQMASRFRSVGTPAIPLCELRNYICTQVGIPYEADDEIFNDYFECRKPEGDNLSSVSFNTILKWICEIQCTVPHIGRDGILRFISLSNRPYKNITDSYNKNTAEFEGFRTASIDAVEFYDINNEVASTNSTGAVPTKNPYILKDNVLLSNLVSKDENNAVPQATADFLEAYYGKIHDIRYTPYNLDMIVSDMSLSVGDHIAVVRNVNSVGSFILQSVLSGPMLVDQELRADGDEYYGGSGSTQTAAAITLQRQTDGLRNEIITDDLLNYAYMNSREYDITNVVTPIIALEITMPQTSNLVFLATVNLETFSTETREVQETVRLGDVEYTMTRTEKVPVVVESYFEWNGATILSNMPTETYSEDGKHLLNLMFFTIGGRQVGGDVTFKVFLKVYNGRVHIGQNQVNATIISKGSSAGSLPWDGTITLEENITQITAGTFTTNVNSLTGTVLNETQNPTPSVVTDTVGLITPEFGTISINDINDTVEPSIK